MKNNKSWILRFLLVVAFSIYACGIFIEDGWAEDPVGGSDGEVISASDVVSLKKPSQLASAAAAQTTPVTMPSVGAPAKSDANGNITLTFINGTLDPAELSSLGANVTYDGKTEYWVLNPGMISSDGTTMTMQLGSEFNGKTMQFSFVAKDLAGNQTLFSNRVSVLIDSSASSLVIPTISAPSSTDVNGNVTLTFTSGTLKPTDITALGANVTFNGKTEYWVLNPAMISADGKTITMQLGSEFNAKVMQFQFIATDNSGKLTSFSNKVSFVVNSSASSLVIPNISAPSSTDVNGNVTLTFTNGTLKSTDITDLGANVTFDGKTVYWVLNPSMLSADGKTMTMQLGSEFNGKTMQFQFIAKDNSGKLTSFSNKVSLVVDSSASSLVMPNISAPSSTDVNGNVTFTFTNGTLKSTDISAIGANVTFDGKTTFWVLNSGMISSDGKTMTMQLGSEFNGKIVQFEFIATDTSGKLTSFSNKVSVVVNSSPSSLVMPNISAPSSTDVNGNVTFTFTNGTLKPADITALGANVTVDGQTTFWVLDPASISADGKTIAMTLGTQYNGKTMQFQFIATDNSGKQTSFSNKVSVLVNSSASTLVMPAISAPSSTDVNGNVTFTFTNGTLKPTDITALGANVTVDGQTTFWTLNPSMISADGKTIAMTLGTQYNGKTMQFQFIATDNSGKQTSFSNKVSVLVNSSASTLVMPAISAPSSTDVNGNVTFTFTNGTLKPADITALGANVTVDGQTTFWTLNPGMISTDGKTMVMQLGTEFNGKTMQFQFIATDTSGKLTSFSNKVSVVVNSSPSSLVMPNISAPSSTDVNGNVTFTFTNGTLKPADITALGANVTVDGQTTFWVLDPASISADGKTIAMSLGAQYNGKTMQFQFIATDNSGKQTSFSNKVSVLVNSSASTLVMPAISAPSSTDVNGNVTFTFTNGTLKPADITALGANVTVDGQTTFWTLNPGMISTDGKTMVMQLGTEFNGKTMQFQFIATDTSGKLTSFSNKVSVVVNSSVSSLVMPNISAPAVSDASGKVVFSFINGTLNPNDISALGANVTFGSANTEYWILNTDEISTDGKTISMSFGSQYDGKTAQIEFIAKDMAGKSTAFSNKVSVLIDSNPTSLVMPTISAPSGSDPNGNVVFTFVGGTLKPAEISDLGVNVTVDGKTEYWALNPGMISADGTTMSMRIDSKYDGKIMQFQFIAKDLAGKQTAFSNSVNVLIDSNPSSVLMPQITTAAKSDPNGNVVFTFTNGTLKPAEITALGANVTINGGNVEYWTLNPADVLSADGTTITMSFGAQYDAKTVQIEFTAKDLLGKQTSFSNKVSVLIDSKPSSLVMPTISAPVKSDSNGNIVFSFTNGTLLPADISEFGANVTFDNGTTEYWILNTGMISVDGKSMQMQIPSTYNGKTMQIEFIAKDTAGKWSIFSNKLSILIDNSPV